MDERLAFKILGISENENLTYDIIRKQFRFKAKQWHPDKFLSEPKKLRATKEFIKIKEAYDFLFQSITEDTLINENLTEEYFTQNNSSSEHDYHSKNDYIEKTPWYIYLNILMIPGSLYLGLSLGLFYIVKDDINEESFADLPSAIGMSINLILFSLMLLAPLWYLVKNTLNGNIVSEIILSQIFLTIIYYKICNLIRRQLERKYLIKYVS